MINPEFLAQPCVLSFASFYTELSPVAFLTTAKSESQAHLVRMEKSYSCPAKQKQEDNARKRVITEQLPPFAFAMPLGEP